MAEVNGASDGRHVVGHSGVGPDCPVSCLGIRTVGDLVGLLVEAGRISGIHTVSTVPDVDLPHDHADDPVSRRCPVACLVLSAQLAGVLRTDRQGRPRTVGDLLDLESSGGLLTVAMMGPRRVGEVRAALRAAGFPVSGAG